MSEVMSLVLVTLEAYAFQCKSWGPPYVAASWDHAPVRQV